MNKDVIYIDVEDDITAIIGKVKNASEKIVAVVPPKRIGILQSAVNLQLLSRSAKQAGKRLVLITNNTALLALAANAKIPVAKNLQSKPELAEITALKTDDGDDIIDGSQLPIGELEKTADAALGAAAINEAEREKAFNSLTKATPPANGKAGKPKVPNFNVFRKKLVFIIAGAVLLVGFLVWALFFAPRATVVITARTSDSSMNASVIFDQNAATKLSSGTIKAEQKTSEKDADVTFDATGKKEVGDKASGQVVFENCESSSTITVPAGTSVSANGRDYTTQATVRVPGGSGGFDGCSSPGESSPVAIEASAIGQEYNVPNGTAFRVAGHSSNSSSKYFRATASTAVNGGSKKEIKVVSDDDVRRAIDRLQDENTDEVKKQLTSQFDNAIIIDETFTANRDDVKPNPAVGDEANNGKAKLSGAIKYSILGASKNEVSRYLDEYYEKQLEGTNDQRVYENGIDDVTITSVNRQGEGYRANITTTAKIGPMINDNEIKDRAKGKRYGDIQSGIESINGVEDVDVQFWPFWVSTAPDDGSRIIIEFKLNESE